MCHILGWTIGDVFGNSQVVEHPLARGKVHISLEIDEQKITAFGTPDQIDQHILNCIQKLGSPTAGLSLHYTAYPGDSDLKRRICCSRNGEAPRQLELTRVIT